MKTKSVIFDIYSSSEDTAEVEKAYQHFLAVIQSAIINIIDTCKIRIDVGEYMFFDNGIIRHIDTPEIHIIAQGKNIDYLQRVIEKEVADLPFFNTFDRFSFFEKTFNHRKLQ